MQLQQIVARLVRRIGRCLERAGWLRRQDDTLEADGLERLRSHSILYRASLRLFKIAPGNFVNPLDFIARLAALMPPPRANLLRYHGVFAPNSSLRAQITPAGRGKRCASTSTPAERH